MEASEVAGWVGAVTGVLGLVAAVLGFTIGLSRYVTRMDERFRQLVNQGNNHLELTGLLLAKAPMSPQELAQVVRVYTSIARVPTSPPSNPLNPDEARRYGTYIDKANQGLSFTPEEVRDFQGLAQKLQQERPNDASLWPLLGLVALLVGLYVLSKGEDRS